MLSALGIGQLELCNDFSVLPQPKFLQQNVKPNRLVADVRKRHAEGAGPVRFVDDHVAANPATGVCSEHISLKLGQEATFSLFGLD